MQAKFFVCLTIIRIRTAPSAGPNADYDEESKEAGLDAESKAARILPQIYTCIEFCSILCHQRAQFLSTLRYIEDDVKLA
jgi:hypothetical protein